MGSAGDDYLRNILGPDYGSDSGDAAGDPSGESSSSSESEGAAAQPASEQAAPGSDGYTDTLHERMEQARESENSWWGDTLAPMFGLGDQGGHASGSPAGGTGYTFDSETVAALISDFDGLSNEVDDNAGHVGRLGWWLSPPTDDAAAAKQVRATMDTLATASEHSQKMAVYVKGFYDSLRKANGTYDEQEQSVSALFKGSGDGGDATSPGTGALFA